MSNALILGIGAAILAAVAWSTSFIVPFVIGPYSLFDFAFIEFVASGAMGLAYLLLKDGALQQLELKDWLSAACLGCIGYLGYFLALTGAAVYAGPVIAPAFLGLVPVVMAVAGNLREPIVAWRELLLPLALATLGLLLVNASNLGQAGAHRVPSLALGIALAMLAVSCWTCFGLLNERALARRPKMAAGVWTALMMVGAAAGMGVFLPLGLAAGAFEIPRLGLGWGSAAALYAWATGMALVANFGAALAWTFASQRLPLVLAAQLITMEPTFGTIFGLSIRRQWPTPAEGLGMGILLVGVVAAIRVFHAPRPLAATPL